MTAEQAQELSRLAGLWATSRVRRALVSHGCGARGETEASVGTGREKPTASSTPTCVRLFKGSDISETRPPWASTSGEKHEQN